jgi:light-regulated signal transduction histidine kinase (bacteriophytochrome)
MKTGDAIIAREEALTAENGRLTWLSTTKVPLYDKAGECTGVMCVSGDITPRKEADELKRLASEQLQRSNRELEEFAAVASHDLQEPLRKIQAFGDRLKTKCGPALGETGNDYLERMLDAAGRMRILLQDLLTLSRVTSKAQPFALVNLETIVREVGSDLEVRIEQGGAKVKIEPLPTIEADSLQMRQLFQNLIANALKFQRPGAPPEVVISAKTFVMSARQIPGAEPGDEVCEIAVRDNGIGFDGKKYGDKIFQVFQRLHSRDQYEGTGIGLAVCRKIALRHGGAISAKSAEGEGATFSVTLPVKQRMRKTDEDSR